MTAIEQIRRKLRARLLELARQLTNLDIDAAAGDDIDLAFANDNTAIQSALAEHDVAEVAQITEALARIDSGKYGNCAGCQKKIPLARLRAMPHAAYCIACQRVSENGHGHPHGNGHGNGHPKRYRGWERAADLSSSDPDFSVGLVK